MYRQPGILYEISYLAERHSVEAQYASAEVTSPYLSLEIAPKEETTGEDFELDPTKVCLITDPDCESCS